MTYQANFPTPTVPLVEPQTGVITQTWQFFFVQLWNRTGGGSGNPASVSAVTLTGSPFSYTATTKGNLLIRGGTVSAVTLNRNGTIITCPTSGFIPVSNGDIVLITYSANPTVSFLPS